VGEGDAGGRLGMVLGGIVVGKPSHGIFQE
jgi:hypothetical protein